MKEKKYISKERLKEFYDELLKVYNFTSDDKIKEHLLYLIEYYEKFILEKEKDDLNNLKRKIYLDMKNSKDESTNKKLYELYQLLKKV